MNKKDERNNTICQEYTEGYTLQNIGERYNLSRERIRQIVSERSDAIDLRIKREELRLLKKGEKSQKQRKYILCVAECGRAVVGKTKYCGDARCRSKVTYANNPQKHMQATKSWASRNQEKATDNAKAMARKAFERNYTKVYLRRYEDMQWEKTYKKLVTEAALAEAEVKARLTLAQKSYDDFLSAGQKQSDIARALKTEIKYCTAQLNRLWSLKQAFKNADKATNAYVTPAETPSAPKVVSGQRGTVASRIADLDKVYVSDLVREGFTRSTVYHALTKQGFVRSNDVVGVFVRTNGN